MTVSSMLVALSSTACNNFALTISTKRTAVMYQPAPGKTYQEPAVTVSGQRLAAVGKFAYLGSTPLSLLTHLARISKPSSAFGCLEGTFQGQPEDFLDGIDRTSRETLAQNQPTQHEAVAKGAVAYQVQCTKPAETTR